MPIAPIDEHGTIFYYEDSGPPRHHDLYTTVVFVHGTYYHGGIFQKTLPLASKHALRIITYNQRDFALSTPFHASEIEQLWSEDDGTRLTWLKERGKELGRFLIWLVRNAGVIPIRDQASGKGGGISIVGWSAGNYQVLPCLAYAHELFTEEEKGLLKRYLRSYVMLGAFLGLLKLILFSQPCTFFSET
ncbi:hypothetical protein K474DRAFT_1600021 [Panus rudis PR-1116 ss-1]|nr:hypothetical protein K474DRAFT_1600021 [Panus rudis PR-1116 ss-1]